MKRIDVANPFNAPVYHEECVSSTMDTVRFLASHGEVHGTVIFADFQESGRGRQGRPWKTEKGQNLTFSIFLNYPDFSLLPEALTLKTGLAVSLAIEDFFPALAGSVKLKWPNDVMLCMEGEPEGGQNAEKVQSNGKEKTARKAAGILAEAESAAEGRTSVSGGVKVYVGIGVNLAQRYFPQELQAKAGSLLSVFEERFPGRKIPDFLLTQDAPRNLLERILIRLYSELEETADLSGFPRLRAKQPWKARLEERLYKRGELVSFAEGAGDSVNIIHGRLVGIGGEGELLIVPQGEEKARPFVTGELRVYSC